MPEQNVAQASAPSAVPGLPKPPIAWRAYAQLVRLPNVFTAFSDIGFGLIVALATGSSTSCLPIFLLLAASSGCLYCGGMVWNLQAG